MNNLRRIRKERKLTQKELSRKTGISNVNLCRYETGNRKLPVETAKKIACVLGVEWYNLY